MPGFVLIMTGFVLNMTGFVPILSCFFLGLLLEMIGYGGKLDYHDQPRSIKTKHD